MAISVTSWHLVLVCLLICTNMLNNVMRSMPKLHNGQQVHDYANT